VNEAGDVKKETILLVVHLEDERMGIRSVIVGNARFVAHVAAILETVSCVAMTQRIRRGEFFYACNLHGSLHDTLHGLMHRPCFSLGNRKSSPPKPRDNLLSNVS